MFVRQALPLTTATHTEVLTHGSHALVREFVEFHRLCLGITMLLALDLEVYDVTRHHIGYKNHEVVHLCNCFAFCGNIGDENILEKGEFFLFTSHFIYGYGGKLLELVNENVKIVVGKCHILRQEFSAFCVKTC